MDEIITTDYNNFIDEYIFDFMELTEEIKNR